MNIDPNYRPMSREGYWKIIDLLKKCRCDLCKQEIERIKKRYAKENNIEYETMG